MTTWVSWMGEIRQADEKPEPKGWASCVEPYDTPANFDPNQDYWIHLVVDPEGEPHYMHLRVDAEGRWEFVRSLDQEEIVELVKQSRSSYGVENKDGKFRKMERWT